MMKLITLGLLLLAVKAADHQGEREPEAREATSKSVLEQNEVYSRPRGQKPKRSEAGRRNQMERWKRRRKQNQQWMREFLLSQRSQALPASVITFQDYEKYIYGLKREAHAEHIIEGDSTKTDTKEPEIIQINKHSNK